MVAEIILGILKGIVKQLQKSFRLLYWLVFLLALVFVLGHFGSSVWFADAFSQSGLLSFLSPWIALLYGFALGFLLPVGLASFALSIAFTLAHSFLLSKKCPKLLTKAQDSLCNPNGEEHDRPTLGFCGTEIRAFAEFLLLLFTSITLISELAVPGSMSAIPSLVQNRLVHIVVIVASLYCTWTVTSTFIRLRYREQAERKRSTK